MRGLAVGADSGLNVAAGIRGMELPAWTERIRLVGVLLLGLAFGLLMGRGANDLPGGPAWVTGALVLFLAGLLSGDPLRRWGPALLLVLVLVGWWFVPA
jgi:hypothetical protein